MRVLARTRLRMGKAFDFIFQTIALARTHTQGGVDGRIVFQCKLGFKGVYTYVQKKVGF